MHGGKYYRDFISFNLIQKCPLFWKIIFLGGLGIGGRPVSYSFAGYFSLKYI